MARPSKQTIELQLVEEDQNDNWFCFIDRESDCMASLRLDDGQWFAARDWNQPGLLRNVYVPNFWKGVELIKNHHNAIIVAKEKVLKRLSNESPTLWGKRKKSLIKEISNG